MIDVMTESKIAPGFLVAAPQLKDPHFESTVILMLDHNDDEGSLGLVINRPAVVKLEAVLGEMKIATPDPVDLSDHPPLLYGGPVSPERGWILHTPDWTGPGTRAVDEGLSVTASKDILDAIASGAGPEKYRFCLGYAGWGPHQLIEEIKTGAWINVPFDVDLVFDVDLENRWRSALSRLGIDPSQLVSVVGDA
jgi:putative transcriptional regulator